MDFMKMWFNLKEDLNKKKSWSKKELKILMESIEIEFSNKKGYKAECIFIDEFKGINKVNVEEISDKLSNKLKERMKNKGEWI